ncbi:MAG: hypothetical protein ABIJ50_09730 [Pseudomonadota bacterium]
MESKNWQPLIFLVVMSILIVVAGGWQYNKKYFTPNEARIQTLNQELATVKSARQAWDEALARGLNGDAVYETRFNYFTKDDIPLPTIQPRLLKELTPFFEEHQMDFLGLVQQEREKQDLLTIVSFTLTGGARFADIVSLVRWLEEEKHAVVSGLTIAGSAVDVNEGKKSQKAATINGKAVEPPALDNMELQRPDDWLSFSLKWHWVEGVPKNFTSVVTPPALANQEVERNPFRSYAQETTVIPEKNNKKGEDVVFRPAPESLQLNGIMAIKDGYKALINNKYLEAGMNFEEFHIVEINADEVILGKERFRYRLRIARKQY